MFTSFFVASFKGTCTVTKSAARNTSSSERAFLTDEESCHAPSTVNPGSKPTTFMPSETAVLATSRPIAPSPITPSVRPGSSYPANVFFCASTALLSSSSDPSRLRAKSHPSQI